MFWKPIDSRDPLILSAKAIAWRDPTGSGNEKTGNGCLYRLVLWLSD